MALDPHVPIQVYQERFERGELSTDEYSQILDEYLTLQMRPLCYGESVFFQKLQKAERLFGSAATRVECKDGVETFSVTPEELFQAGAARRWGKIATHYEAVKEQLEAWSQEAHSVSEPSKSVDRPIFVTRVHPVEVEVPWLCGVHSVPIENGLCPSCSAEIATYRASAPEPLKPRSDSEMPDWLKPYAE